MIRLKLLLFVILAGTIVVPAVAESAESDYKAGMKAEKQANLDAAYQSYKRAHDLKPSDTKYLIAYTRMRFHAAAEHMHKGRQFRDTGSLQDAMAELRQAVEIDPANFEALGLLRATAEMIQTQEREKEQAKKNSGQPTTLEKEAKSAGGPVALDIKWDTPISLHLTSTTVDVVYKTMAKIAGINVLIDPDYKPQKINFELQDVSLRQAMEMIAMQSRTFWRPVSSNTIMVAADTGSKRKELEQNVMKTFYLKNAASPADLQQAAGTLKAILDINRVQVTPDQRSLTLRGTPDQMVLAQKLLADIDKPKAEVMVDVLLMEVSKNYSHTIGTNPPTSATVTLAPGGTTSSGSGGSSSGSSNLTLDTFTHLSAGDFAVTIPGISFSLLASDSHTKVLQRPEVRVLDSEKASLKIGDRVPIATGSFQSGFGGSVNTQFQYLDVGVNIDITPYIHAGNEVTLKMSIEVSSVTGVQSIGGFNQPTIGQRRIEHEARLKDGEVNLIAGLLNDSESTSLSGYPWLLKVPILKYLFAQENRQKSDSELVFAVIPHIIRGYQTDEDNLREVDLGSGNTVTYRKAAIK